MDLADASVMVTGAGSGLGAATARLLAERAQHVVLVDIDDAAGKAVAERIGGQYVHADITDQEEVVAAVEAAVRVAPLRGVVSCAGGGSSRRAIGRDGRVESAHPLGEFARILTLNTVGTFNVVRIAASYMSGNEPDAGGGRGALVNTASAAAFDGQIGQTAYSAAKAGIVGMTLPLARDLASVGIRVNTIAPGVFATPPMLAVPEQPRERLTGAVPFPRRAGEPAEFAELALHLLTNDYLNGESIRLDGALRMPAK
ncbi:MAG TPA: SDR family NAD(P)-dependent oxidoreductase [Pseudonocardia sp.]|jgi:NAD(P)-dependent dehydrogenase (short-subunit alcohol dehydrogenase family)